MATNEALTLDTVALNDGTNFDLESFEFLPAPKRPRWIEGTDSDGAVLDEPPHVGNRTATVTLRVSTQASMDAALDKIGQIVDKLYEAEQQPDGLPLVWVPADATQTATAYVLSGEITGLPIELSAGWFQKSPTITLRLDCKPYMEGTEVTSAATVTNTDPVQILTVAGVTGDVPALGRLVVTDDATQSRRHLEWGLQWRHYDAATSLLIDSDSLVTAGFAGTGTTRSGAYDVGGGNTVIRGTLTSSPQAICGTGNLGHVGTFRVKARVYAAATSDATADDFKVRLTWREGDGPQSSNAYTSPVAEDTWCEVDLGLISIPVKLLGTQRWTGQIEAYSEDAGDTLDVDYIVLIPTDQYGIARATYSYVPGVGVARDEFTSIVAGTALNARVAPAGGTWATSGDATDFAASDSPTGEETQTRGTNAIENTGRFAILGSTDYTNVEVGASVRFETAPVIDQEVYGGVVARWVDASNHVRAYITSQAATSTQRLVLVVVATTETTAYVDLPVTPATWYRVRLVAFTSGRVVAMAFDNSGNLLASVTLTSTALATGGAIATGKPGFWDRMNRTTVATAIARYYDNFYVATPASDPVVVSSGQSAEIRYDGAIREDSTGTYWGPVPSYRGAHFFLPPAGDENRTSRILVKPRRNDIAVAADDQVADSTTCTVHYTPRFSSVPR